MSVCGVFKKPGGGKGRPGRNMRCMGCGITWESHGSATKVSVSIAKRKPIIIEELPEEIEEPVIVTMTEVAVEEISIPKPVLPTKNKMERLYEIAKTIWV